MKKATLEVLRYQAEDVIATSAVSPYCSVNSGHIYVDSIVANNLLVSSTGEYIVVGNTQLNGQWYASSDISAGLTNIPGVSSWQLLGINGSSTLDDKMGWWHFVAPNKMEKCSNQNHGAQ